jgi:hypothetical protein
MNGTTSIKPLDVGYIPTDFGIKDKNDCAIRALANVSALSYPEAHTRITQLGRRKNRGTPWAALHTAYTEAGAKEVAYFGNKMFRLSVKHNVKLFDKGFTLKTFVSKKPIGRHIVLVKGHALAVCNGSVIDTFASRAGKRVIAVYSFD